MTGFARHLADRAGRGFDSHQALHDFAVSDPTLFWQSFLDWSGLRCEGDRDPVVTGTSCETARFFPELRLSYVESLLAGGAETAVALTSCHADRPTERLTRGELRAQVLGLAAGLHAVGIGPGDRIAMVARNDASAVIACLGAATAGAAVATLAPDLGLDAAVDRLSQVRPTLLFAHLGRGGGPAGLPAAELAGRTPSIAGLVALDMAAAPDGLAIPLYRLADLIGPAPGGQPARLPFNHPLFILFTSGTTGVPKGLIHGAGGTLLEHLKEHRLHCDLRAGDRLFFHTSTGWMMWHWQLSALASGAELVLYDGPLLQADTLWRIVAEHRVTVFGTGPAYLQHCEASGISPGQTEDFAALRAILSTGSILYERHQDWVSRAVKALPVQSISGGSDIIGCFVLGNPNLPVWPAECQCRSLGLDVQALRADDTSLPPGMGELICRNPFPSRPLGLLDDPDGRRFHDAYFAQHSGVWTHGDLIEFTPEGTARMHGRSDGVLNIRGIRIGPAEIYRVLERLPEIVEAMAIEQHRSEEPGNARLVLLVVLRPGLTLDRALTVKIQRSIARDAGSTHVPGLVIAVDALPTTFNGKRSERSARDALNGRPVANLGALINPECLAPLQSRGAEPAAAPLADDAPAPPGGTAGLVAAIWAEILQIPVVDPDVSFFDLGGDSLKALALFRQIARRTGRDLPVTLLYDAPTVAQLAAAIEAPVQPPFSLLVLVKEGDRAAPLFIVHGVGGNVMELFGFGRRLATERAVYAIQARGLDPAQAAEDRIEAMAHSYVGVLGAVQPHGPYALAGYSFGGLVAYEMARQLTAAGESVAFLGLIDCQPHERHWPFAAWAEFVGRRWRQHRASIGGLSSEAAVKFALARSRGFLRHLGRRFTGADDHDFAPLDAAATELLPPHWEQTRAAGIAAFTRYDPGRYPGRVAYFRAENDGPRSADPALVWRPLAGELQILPVPGNHLSLLREPFVDALAERFSGHLPPAHRADQLGTSANC